MKDLEQAKRRNQKVYVTDIAIDKVPFVEYKGFTDKQNRIMRSLAREVLTVAKSENDSNEVAIVQRVRGRICSKILIDGYLSCIFVFFGKMQRGRNVLPLGGGVDGKLCFE